MDEPPQAVVMKTSGGLSETCEEMSEAKRGRIEAEFERLRRLLAEQERTVLGRLAELDHTFAAAHAEKSLRVAEGVAQLHRLIGQLEARCSPQDVGSTLSSWSEMRLHLPSGLPKELEKSLSSCCRQSHALWEALETFRDTDHPMGLPTSKTTLETGTTPLPQLLAERKSVWWDEEEEQVKAREPR
ncbi:E3 ubiquitin-protein ligase TRIM11-like isoform X3 [Cinclus cinclus]|uniref:E3 ubiquitin-protein ligase TRIM11-like isoform X3 n=1 Tax=Cinclus cinclus TaxID=127875 RepID=UPI002E134BAC